MLHRGFTASPIRIRVVQAIQWLYQIGAADFRLQSFTVTAAVHLIPASPDTCSGGSLIVKRFTTVTGALTGSVSTVSPSYVADTTRFHHRYPSLVRRWLKRRAAGSRRESGGWRAAAWWEGAIRPSIDATASIPARQISGRAQKRRAPPSHAGPPDLKRRPHQIFTYLRPFVIRRQRTDQSIPARCRQIFTYRGHHLNRSPNHLIEEAEAIQKRFGRGFACFVAHRIGYRRQACVVAERFRVA